MPNYAYDYDRSHERRQEDYGRMRMQTVPPETAEGQTMSPYLPVGAGGMGNALLAEDGMGREPMMPAPQSREGLRMNSMLTADTFEDPVTNTEMLQASLKGLLMRNIGFYVVASFLVGTGDPISWEGILHSVGTDYILIYQPDVDRYISGDIHSLKFVEFHNTKSVTPWAGYRRQDGGHSW